MTSESNLRLLQAALLMLDGATDGMLMLQDGLSYKEIVKAKSIVKLINELNLSGATKC